MMPRAQRLAVGRIDRTTTWSPALQGRGIDESKFHTIILPKQTYATASRRRLDPPRNGERSAIVQEAVTDTHEAGGAVERGSRIVGFETIESRWTRPGRTQRSAGISTIEPCARTDVRRGCAG